MTEQQTQGGLRGLLLKYREIIMYVIFGVLTTLVNWATYWLIEPPISAALNGDEVILRMAHFELTNATLAIFVANVIAWVAGVIFAFVTNKLWVFESKSWRPSVALKEFWLFVLARIITGVLEWFVVPLLVALGMNQKIFGVDGFLAKIIVSVVVVILNYVFSKLIIFKKTPRDPQA